MTKVRLEFEKLEILRPKERWKLYFVIVAEHPTDPDKMVVTSIPDPYIALKPQEENVINFQPVGVGTDGLFVLEQDMPATRLIRVRVYLRHTRQNTRNIGQILQDMKGQLGGDAFSIVTNILGTTVPWLVIAKQVAPMIGAILKNINDRDFGFLSMDEDFGPEFEAQTELDRQNKFSTGDARITWSWSTRT